MITAKELNPSAAPVTPEQAENLVVLLQRINIVRSRRGLPMTVTSGFRSLADHKRIYMDIAKRKGLKSVHIPMGSAHLKGAAADIADADGSLMQWCKANVAVLEEAQLWCEDGTVGWVHFQTYPPKSGKRFFLP